MRNTKELKSKGISGAHGERNTQGWNPQPGRVAPTNPWIWTTNLSHWTLSLPDLWLRTRACRTQDRPQAVSGECLILHIYVYIYGSLIITAVLENRNFQAFCFSKPRHDISSSIDLVLLRPHHDSTFSRRHNQTVWQSQYGKILKIQ